MHRFWLGSNNTRQAEQAQEDDQEEQFFDAQDQTTNTADDKEDERDGDNDNKDPFGQAESFAQNYEDVSAEDNTVAEASDGRKNRRTGCVKEHMKRAGSTEHNYFRLSWPAA